MSLLQAWDRAVHTYIDHAPVERGKYLLSIAAERMRRARATAGLIHTAVAPGLSLELDLTDMLERGIYWHTWERDTTRLLLDMLQPGWNLVDVGANIGYYTLIGAKAVGEHGRVHAFEPQEAVFDRLEAHVMQNRLANVVLNRTALADASGDAPLFSFADRSHPYASLRPGRGDVMAQATCPVTTLDDYLPQLNPNVPTVMKMDIEGAEWPALRGGTEFLRRVRPMLVVEVGTVMAPSFGYHPREMFEWLRDEFGYSLRLLDVWMPIRPLALDDLDEHDGANAFLIVDDMHLPLLNRRVLRRFRPPVIATRATARP